VRSIFLAVAVLAVFTARADAEIRLIDVATKRSTTLVKDDRTRLVARMEGALLVERGKSRSLVGLDGSRTATPQFDGAASVGPGGRTVRMLARSFELRAPDGRVIGSYPADLFVFSLPKIGWSADGSRVAVLVGGQLRVLDSATGAVLAQRASEGDLTEQAFSPDGSALVFIDQYKAFRLDIATGQTTDLGQKGTAAAWSTTGRIAVTSRDGVAVPGEAGVRAPNGTEEARWSPDGKTLAFSSFVARDECSEPDTVIAVAAPGAAPTTVSGRRQERSSASRGRRTRAWRSTPFRMPRRVRAASGIRGRSGSPATTRCPPSVATRWCGGRCSARPARSSAERRARRCCAGSGSTSRPSRIATARPTSPRSAMP
jgi:hypothetical protein